MAVLTAERIDYREAKSRIVVCEAEKTVKIYLNGMIRYLFQADEIEIQEGREES